MLVLSPGLADIVGFYSRGQVLDRYVELLVSWTDQLFQIVLLLT